MRKEDRNVKGLIQNKESAKRMAENKIKEIKELCDQNEEEVKTITKTTAMFAHFLKNNAIAPYNDSFEVTSKLCARLLLISIVFV